MATMGVLKNNADLMELSFKLMTVLGSVISTLAAENAVLKAL